jgi:23S rRNA pseudouridine1911/1915/1917 synthase
VIPQHPIEVPADAGGQRLDSFLAARAADAPDDVVWAQLSRARFQQLIDTQAVTLDGKPCRAALRLKGGERIVVSMAPPVPMGVTPVPMPLHILYEDADLIVINKAQGLVVHPGAGTHAPTLVHGLLAHCADLSGIGGVMRPGIVHRLDRGTSGAMVVAKHDRAHEGLAKQFEERQVTKRYIALTLGIPNPQRATLHTYYGRHPVHRQRYTSRLQSGKNAITSYAVSASEGGIALLDILLGTGRTHQIRVHLSEIGHPIVGDALYGGATQLARIKDPEMREQAAALPHQALHAAHLAFAHPISGAPLQFSADLPEAWGAIAHRIAKPTS